ncbi:MAG: succinyl-diaminopimelate desuccinylase [Acidobacteriota bacterium]|jgi:succinyl-diaminopimelate desuccinylase|nr:MAG: succinyl-diaminopimelate desuccinylase [Acidobacteriota bacterium]
MPKRERSPGDPQQETRRLAEALIACRSITPDDGGAMALIEERLARAGFVCERIDHAGVRNLWARRGDRGPLVCFAGHVDVVPPGPIDDWTSPPFEPTERDGYLYGRGASDMKGPLAAMITAAERLAAGDVPGSIALLVTSDEEGDAVDGTARVVEWLRARGESIDACIVGEPTSSGRFGDTIKNGRRGSLSGELRVFGVQCHIAYPERGRNPILQALPVLNELASIRWDEGNTDFPPTQFQISNIHAGTGAANVIPGVLEVSFNFRFSPESTAEDLQARVRELIEQHGLEHELVWKPVAQPFATPRGPLVDAVIDAVRAETGIVPELSTSGGTSDGRFVATLAGEVVEFGPTNDTIHKINERIRIADLGALSRIYEDAARRRLGVMKD